LESISAHEVRLGAILTQTLAVLSHSRARINDFVLSDMIGSTGGRSGDWIVEKAGGEEHVRSSALPPSVHSRNDVHSYFFLSSLDPHHIHHILRSHNLAFLIDSSRMTCNLLS
jgi:hypothetical protein